mmetsp:Transcript_91430/g.295830  ORF Transcript_91430/g.295830 Transcript_91430/m.295830 type:complete len:427 (-) Transcript_91430:205-1485(-)
MLKLPESFFSPGSFASGACPLGRLEFLWLGAGLRPAGRASVVPLHIVVVTQCVTQNLRWARRVSNRGSWVAARHVADLLEGIEKVGAVNFDVALCVRLVEHVEVLVAVVGVGPEAAERGEVREEVMHLVPRARSREGVAAHFAEHECPREVALLDPLPDAVVRNLASCVIAPALDVEAENVHGVLFVAAEEVLRLKRVGRVAVGIRGGVHERDAPHVALGGRRVVLVAHLHEQLQIPNVALERGHVLAHLLVELVADDDGEHVREIEPGNNLLAEPEQPSMPVAAIRRSRRVLLPLGVHLPALLFHGRPKTPSSASARHEHIKAEFVRLLEEDVEAAVVWCCECTRGQLVDADRVDVRAQGLDARQHVDPILNNVASVGHADADAEEFVSGHRVVEPGALDLDGVQPEYTLLAREQSLAPRHSRGA